MARLEEELERELERKSRIKFGDTVPVSGLIAGLLAGAIGSESIDSNLFLEHFKQCVYGVGFGSVLGYINAVNYGISSEDKRFGLMMGGLAGLAGKLVHDGYLFTMNHPEYIEKIKELF